jgi:hypothetical protein
MGGVRTLFIVKTSLFMRVRDNMIVWSGLLLLAIALSLAKNKSLFSSFFLNFVLKWRVEKKSQRSNDTSCQRMPTT